MKKTYLNPTLTVVKVQPARILTGSEQGQLDSEQTITERSGFGARKGSFSGWNEEE